MGFLRRLLGQADERDQHRLGHVQAPGWDAISAATDRLYGGVEPQHWGTKRRYREGGPDPLDGISAYAADGPPHWHYVSYGLSELFGKESEDSAVSGWGIELTFRLARDASEGKPPMWPVNVLQNLARYVFESGNVLYPNHHLNANGPIALDQPTEITAMIMVRDPELGAIETPNGSVIFTQIVGTTDDELVAAQEWSSEGILEILGRGNPKFVTDLRRRSLRADPAIEAEIARGIERDGSSMAGVNVDLLEIDGQGAVIRLKIGAMTVDRIQRMVRGRLLHGRDFWIVGPSAQLQMHPAATFEWHDEPDGPTMVHLAPASIDGLLSLPPKAGRYEIAPDGRLIVEVQQTIITDEKGREVGRIG